MNPKVDWFFNKDTQWLEEYVLLRELALDTGLDEELKWRHPCYTYKKKNVFLIHGFKDYCALLFHKCALLRDDAGMLVQQTENVQSARQRRFTNLGQIKKQKAVINAYMHDAIRVEKSGKKVELKKTKEFAIADEFERALKDMPALKKAFNALTPGRQRGYLLYFSSAKQSRTRVARIEKNVERILAGKGLND